MTKTIAVLIGSLRKDSINRKFAKVLEKLGADQFKFVELNLGDLPHYNDDLWANPPKSVTEMKEQVAAADAVLIVSPEYNRSFPGLIKNALDWGTRPYGKNVWSEKPCAVTGTAGGAIGTAVGQAHLRLAAMNCNMIVMHQPEVYLTWSDEVFAADGEVTNESTKEFLQKFLKSFNSFITKVS